MKSALYIHIPFCKEKCLYCDFYSVQYSESLADSYIPVILKELQGLGQDFTSIYIGGGTPSILSRDLLDKLLSGLKKILKPDMEVTIEANPESVDSEKLKLFLDKGINRISIGVQSFDDKKLNSLGRIHDVVEAIEAIGLSKKLGFKNISIDIIFGVGGEDLKAWQDELKKAAGFDIQHISCYSLSYEKDTPLFKMREKKHIASMEEDAAEMYSYAISYLPKAGFRHYEVSNFSKPDFKCSHNLNYWDNNYYIGIGPSAVSYIGGVRSENVKDVKEYIGRFIKGMDLAMSREELAPIQMAKETASVKIRTRDGIDYNWFKNKTGFDFLEIEKEALESLAGQNLIKSEFEGICLTEKGFLFADTVSSAFL